MKKFTSKLSVSDADIKENKSIDCLSKILYHAEIKTHFTLNDKGANIDGEIELLEDRRFFGGIKVQIKTYPDKYIGQPKFDFPTSIFGYAQSSPNLLVFLFAVDCENEIAYWKHINKRLINNNIDKVEQKTITIHFQEDEIVNKDNINEIVKRWKDLHKSTCYLINQAESINQENVLLKVQLEKYQDPTFTIGRDNIIKLQAFIDEYNHLLDYEYNCIKNYYFSNAWKIGIVVFEYGLNELSYITHIIERGDNGLLLKEIPVDRVKYFTNFSSMYQNCRENAINENPKKYAFKLIQEKVKELLKNKGIIFLAEETAIEYIFDFINQEGSHINIKKNESYDLVLLKSILEEKYPSIQLGIPYIVVIGYRQIEIYPLYDNIKFLINRGNNHIHRLYPAKGDYGKSGLVSDWYSPNIAFIKAKFLYEIMPSLFDAYMTAVFPHLRDRINFYNGYDIILVNMTSNNGEVKLNHHITLYYLKLCNETILSPQLLISSNFDSEIYRENEISDNKSMRENFFTHKYILYLGKKYYVQKIDSLASSIFFGNYCLHNMLYDFLNDRFEEYFKSINK